MNEMSVESLSLVYFPDGGLRQKVKEIDFERFNNLSNLVDRMDTIMRERRGVGLAAPQAGLGLSLFIVRSGLQDSLRVFINPKITALSTERELGEEGCLSLPGIYAPIERSLGVELEYFDLKGKLEKTSYEDFVARIIQHEVDHLQGTLFFDHLASGVKRKLLEKYFQSLKRIKRVR